MCWNGLKDLQFAAVACKLSFSLRNKKKSIFPLSKIHCDLWCPAPVSSVQKFRFYIVFVDDCTRFTWMYDLKESLIFMSVV